MVVKDMSMSDIVKKVSSDETDFAVDGGIGAPHKRPLIILVMWNGGIGMVKITDGDYMQGQK